MWHRHTLFHLCNTLLLTGLLSACTIPPVPTDAPVPSVGQRVLVPTPMPVTAAEFADAASSSTDDNTAHTVTDAQEVASPLTSAQVALLAKLPSQGRAPELQNEIWFNSDPLQLVDLQGKVVMVEFWTYG